MLAVPSAAARAQAAHRAADPDNFAYWHMPVGGVEAAMTMFRSGDDTASIASALGVHQSVVANAVGRR